MNAQDRRFVRAVLGEGEQASAHDRIGDFGNLAYRWSLGPDAGQQTTVYRSYMGEGSHLLLTATTGGGLAAPEICVGLDLRLDDIDVERVYGRSAHLIGHLHAPETAPATKDTVQIHFAEDLPDDNPSFGLVKVRGKLLWQYGERHVLRITRQMPVGWPGGDHHEVDESAFTGREGLCDNGAKIHFGIPYLIPEWVLWRSAGISCLHMVILTLRMQT